jgi:hypothetical protein
VAPETRGRSDIVSSRKRVLDNHFPHCREFVGLSRISLRRSIPASN